MSDKEARALGAGSIVQVGDREYHVSPISIQRLLEIQRAAVAYFKREFLQTFADNLDLLPEGSRDGILAAKMEEVAKWDVDKLPTKMAYDASKVNISDEMLKKLEQMFGKVSDDDRVRRMVVAAALDSEQITIEEVEKLTGTMPRRIRIPYDSWWVTAVPAGMIEFVYYSIKPNHPEVTKSEIGTWSMAKIIEANRVAERVTAPDSGNT